MIFGRLFDVQKGNIDRVRKILIDDFGLVPPRNDPFNRTEEDLLIWEDEDGIGRYRVHFYEPFQKDGKYYERIQFKYWLNNRRKREIFERDPMNDAVLAVRASLKGEFSEKELTKDRSIDWILQDKLYF